MLYEVITIILRIDIRDSNVYVFASTKSVITSYSIHYTKLYDEESTVILEYARIGTEPDRSAASLRDAGDKIEIVFRRSRNNFV